MTQTLYVLLVLSLFSCILVVRWFQSDNSICLPSRRGVLASWLILVSYLIINIINFQTRDMGALSTEGLSTQNSVQVIVVLVSLCWSAYLLITRHVSLASMSNGPAYWILWLIVLYAASTIWSTWPSMTIFRVAELAAFLILATHIFATGDWFRQAETLLWIALCLYLFRGFLFLMGFVEGVSSEGSIVGLLRSNDASLIAGLVLLWSAHRFIAEKTVFRMSILTIPAGALILFGSLATALTLMISMGILVALHVKGNIRLAFVALSSAIVLAFSSAVLMISGNVVKPVLEGLSYAFAKPTEHIAGMTGRVELWSNIWQATKDQPWGFGFSALERTLSSQTTSMSWTAGNAHNGFISAWLGAGWLAVALLVTFFFSILVRSLKLERHSLPLVLAAVLLVGINNLSVPAVGGRLTVIFIFVMALTQVRNWVDRPLASRQPL